LFRDVVEVIEMRRALLWGLLAHAVGFVVVLALFGRGGWLQGRADPPPVLGQVPVFEFANRDGRVVSFAEFEGSPWVADFFFTRCRTICPRLTAEMKALGKDLPEGVRRVSFSVDPAYDTPAILASYCETQAISDPDWFFLTGDWMEMYELITGGFKLGLEGSAVAVPDGEEDLIIHSSRFVLVDGTGAIRGYYDIFQPGEPERLIGELEALLAAET